MSHLPPCAPNEVEYDGRCYPRFNHLLTLESAGSTTFVLGEVPPALIPELVEKAGDQAHVLVKKSGATVDLTISAVPQEIAGSLKLQLEALSKR